MSIPWRLTTDFNKQQHLFYKKIETDYLVEAFSCSCGHTDFAIKYPKQKIKYICPECENSDFYDANIAWQNIDYFLSKNENMTLSFDYDVSSDENGVVLSYVTLIPKRIDFLRNRVIYEKKSIYSIEVTVDGKVTKAYVLPCNDEVFRQLENKLVRYLRRYKFFNIPYATDNTISLKKVKFFLKYKHLKDIDFYRWKEIEKIHDNLEDIGDIDINIALELVSNFRKEKSVKRAVYSNYINQIENDYVFDPGYIDVFTMIIEDSNILVKFLELDFVSLGYLGREIQPLLIFLKQYYTEKQIFKLFSVVQNDVQAYNFFIDSVKMFYYDRESISLVFRKTKCNIRSIHDEFSGCLNRSEYTGINYYEFKYNKFDIKACVKLNHDYDVKLPKSNQELYEWGEYMHNCIASYDYLIRRNETVIYGFFNGDTLQFVAEISDHHIKEASGKYNAILNQQESSILQIWFRRFFTVRI